MKKIIMSAIAVLITGSVIMAQTTEIKTADTKAATTEVKSASMMKFETEVYDFGTIKQGDKVEHSFEFVNSGKEPLIITEAHGSCGCTVPEYPKNPIKKGEKGMIKVTFNSTGKMGNQDKTVTITSNAPDSPKVLHIKGMVEQVAATPESKPTETPKN